MFKFLDDFLNQITMYRLVLYFLIILLAASSALSFFDILPFNYISILLSAAFVTTVCWIINKAFSKFLKIPTNYESFFITALILSLIITPATNLDGFIFLGLAAFFAMASKYFLAINRKHIFNPVAVAIVITAIFFSKAASWWIGTSWMVPLTLFGGLLIIKKIQRFSMVLSFFLVALVFILISGILKGSDTFFIFQKTVLETPILFFAFIMLPEPQTTPPTKKLQILYGSLVGSFYFTPELALLLGNLFSYIFSPKYKLLLNLKRKILIALNTYEFVFVSSEKLKNIAGQYMEWTLPHKNVDSRGNRRFFTIASSPTEENVRIGIKFYPNGSSFKRNLVNMEAGDKIVSSQLSGEFILPNDPSKKLVFIAGGIGITPFRSIMKYLLDTNQKKDIVLFYSNNMASDIVYKDIFDEARQKLGLRTVYTLTDTKNIPQEWRGKAGYVDDNMIKEEVPDYKERAFYISGPHSMIEAFKKTLKDMGIPQNQIKVDFFPGYV